MVPPSAHRDFLEVPGLNSSRSLTWTRKWPSIFTRQDFVNSCSSHDTISPGPLTEKEGTDNVYLDGQVMGSNPGVRSRSYGESPQIPKSIQPNYNYPSLIYPGSWSKPCIFILDPGSRILDPGFRLHHLILLRSITEAITIAWLAIFSDSSYHCLRQSSCAIAGNSLRNLSI